MGHVLVISRVAILSRQLYAKQHKDAKLMAEIMDLLHKNDLPLQPGTADLVFRYTILPHWMP